jgi:curli biogenesis system outer membrane secretion channel CsgG
MNRSLFPAGGLALLLIAAAASARPVDPNPALAAARAAPCVAPKKRLAVLRFGGTGKYGAMEGADVGEAIAGQLATALEHTGCFILSDRLALSEVLREQEIGMAGVASRETAARAGALIGAQILVKGEITEFEPGKQGNAVTAGIGLAKLPLGLRLGGNRNVAHIGLDVRLIDASTGQVIASQRVESQSKSFGLLLGVDAGKASVATDNFSKTPLGIAMREAVTEAAGYILDRTRSISWSGQVVDVQGTSFYLNAGANAGLKVGDSLTVSTVARELIDPASGVSIGRIEQSLGTARVDQIDEAYAVAVMVGDFHPHRGDVLRR